MKKRLSIYALLLFICISLVGCTSTSSKRKLPVLEGKYYLSDTEYISFYDDLSFNIHSANINYNTFGEYEIKEDHYVLNVYSIATMAQRTDTYEAYPRGNDLSIDGRLFVKR